MYVYNTKMSNKPGQANIGAGAALQQRHHLSETNMEGRPWISRDKIDGLIEKMGL